MKKQTYILLILALFLSFTSCKSDNNKSSKTEETEITFQFQELSDISSMSCNKTVKYTKEYTDVPLYEWNKNIVFPVPKPEGEIKEEQSIDSLLVFSGLTKENWLDYVKKLKESYPVTDYREITEYDYDILHEYMEIKDEENGFYISFSWESTHYYADGTKKDGVLSLYCYMENQEKNNTLSKKDIKEQILNKLEIETEKRQDFFLYNVTSHTNKKDGFDVYLLTTPFPYNNGDEDILSYLCVLKDKEIVFLEPNIVSLGNSNNEIEFLFNENQWEMYVLAFEYDKDISMSNPGKQIIDKYVLSDNQFKHTKCFNVHDIQDCENKYITFEKNENSIDLYELVIDTDSWKAYYELWSVGEKIGTLD